MPPRDMGAKPIFARVPGAPYQPGDEVAIRAAVDVEIHDVSDLIGERGVVEYLEYVCGCGQVYPHDPMIGVRFALGFLEEFWAEELGATP